MQQTMKEQILALKAEGLSYTEIQNKLGCSKGTIAYHVGIGQKNKTCKRKKDSRNKIRKFLQEYKSTQKCVDCKEDYPYWILEFDHLEDKHFTISNFSSKTSNIETIKKEIAKCDVVCSNCHKNRTFYRLLTSGDSVDWQSCIYSE